VAAVETRRPDGLAAARDAVLAARDMDASILVRGGGTKLAWGAQPSAERPWLAIDTRRLSGLVRHDPGDMTATVLAGTPLAGLQDRFAAAGQELAVDPPHRGGAPTVGGVVAANDAGPRRFRFGGVRDLVIGATVVLADGTVARSGGTVIKNVAGYDLAKLWCGSLGTLALIVELTVRLHPLPEAQRVIRIPAPAPAATSFVLDLAASPVECSAVEWSSSDGALLVALEGRSGGLAGQVDALAALARRNGLALEDGDDGLLDAWRNAHTGGDAADVTVARAATLPSDLARAAEELAATARGPSVQAALVSHAGLGLHDAVLTGGTPSGHAEVLENWRDRLAGWGTVVLRERRAGVAELVDPWGPTASLGLMRSVKAALDPDGRFAPGRFAGGI
jgi:glycolate oxidase FAD binding subunit